MKTLKNLLLVTTTIIMMVAVMTVELSVAFDLGLTRTWKPKVIFFNTLLLAVIAIGSWGMMIFEMESQRGRSKLLRFHTATTITAIVILCISGITQPFFRSFAQGFSAIYVGTFFCLLSALLLYKRFRKPHSEARTSD